MKALLALLILSCGLNVLLFLHTIKRPDKTFERNSAVNKPNESELRTAFPFLSPRAFIENPNDRLMNFTKLREQLRAYHQSAPPTIGLYFEFLPTGVSIGINEKDSFILASLLKVPLVMGVYKAVNDGKLKLDQMLTIREENLNAQFGDLWKQGSETSLTVLDAIKQTLIHSDNTAKSILMDQVGSDAIEDVYNNLDIPMDIETNRPVMTPKNYSSVLRSLYLSSYLPFNQSNEILTFMTQSVFTDKLAAGVPANIPVAHKIGVYLDASQADQSVYTDCGIVYVPKRPYILCLMTKGSENHARTTMRTISKIVYDYVASY